MALTKTNLYLRGTPLDPAFKGTPQQFFEAMLSHTDIVAPFGINTFVVSSQQPTSDNGPWLKDGIEWWVWDKDLKPQAGYRPVTVTSSLPQFYFFQEATPSTTAGISIWFETMTINGLTKAVAINLLVGGTWQRVSGPPRSGGTADRPDAANTVPFTLFYDTDIEAMLVCEDEVWKTQDGVMGDVKYVTWTTRYDALLHNPGWEILWDGPAGSTPANRGLVIGQATRDFDGANAMAVSGSAGQHGAVSLSGSNAAAFSLALDNLPAHSHDIRGDASVGEVGFAHRTGDNYPTSDGWLSASGFHFYASGQPTPTQPTGDVAAQTALTGRTVPLPVSVSFDPPALWLYMLRKA